MQSNLLFVAKIARNKTGNTRAWFICQCGEYTISEINDVKRGRTKSCGCLSRKMLALRSTTHGQAPGNGSVQRTGAYKSYTNAKARCTNPNRAGYIHYGAKGIKFLFPSFEAFFAELGERPDGMSIDRIDNNGHYEEGNVRWATSKQQYLNRVDYPKNGLHPKYLSLYKKRS